MSEVSPKSEKAGREIERLKKQKAALLIGIRKIMKMPAFFEESKNMIRMAGRALEDAAKE